MGALLALAVSSDRNDRERFVHRVARSGYFGCGGTLQEPPTERWPSPPSADVRLESPQGLCLVEQLLENHE